MTSRTPRLAASLMLLGVVGTGCAGRSCTAIGASSGLSVRVDGFPRALDGASVGPDVVTVQVCLARTCVSSDFDGGRGDTLYFELPFISTDPVDVSVAVHGTTGVLLPTTTYRLTPRTYSPNGPGCAPTVYRADLDVAPPELGRS